MPHGALVVERALGEGRFATSRVVGDDIEADALYARDGLIRPDVLVLAPRHVSVVETLSTEDFGEDINIDELVQGARELLGAAADTITQTPAQIRAWAQRTLQEFTTASSRPAVAQRIALEARQSPMQGLMRALAYLPIAMATYPRTLWSLMTISVEDHSSHWKTRVLPEPGAERKYLIFSDLHRDTANDDRGPFMPGSIDHFTANARLYCRFLDYARDNQYTVLEAGDCEELWFIRDPAEYMRPNARNETGVVKTLREIIETYSQGPDDGPINVYARLRNLHRNGRYFRLYGNHDSFLKTDPAAQVLIKSVFNRPGTPAFQIYDAFVIPGVKTMFDHSWLDLLDDLASASRSGTPTAPMDQVLRGRLGLDSNDYTEKCKMLVTHGHQFDFWNCEQNQLLGLIISNTVASFVDRNMDPFLDLQGLAVQGNPLFQIDDLFASLPVLNSWVSRQPAVKAAHRVQHMDNRQRQLTDNIMYKESLAALLGTFGLALHHGNTSPSQSRASLDLTSVAGIQEYVRRHHSHHICIGHTHNPHSQPFMTLSSLAALAPPLAPLISRLRALLPGNFEPMLKTGYFNSGTGGWMEGVIWAIEVDQTGQARLVYWTDTSRRPESMDWELQPLPRRIKDRLLSSLTSVLPNLARDAAATAGGTPNVGGFASALAQRLAALNISREEISSIVYERMIVPLNALGAAFTREAASGTRQATRALRDLDAAVGNVEGFLRGQLQIARDFMSDVTLTVRQRLLSGVVQGREQQQFVLTAPVPAGARAQLERLRNLYVAQGYPADRALHYAALAFGAVSNFPRNWPTLGAPIRNWLPVIGRREAMAPTAMFPNAPSPALHAMVTMLWMFPAAGEPARIGSAAAGAVDELSSRLDLLANPSILRLTVTIRRVSAAQPPPRQGPPLVS